MSHQQHWTTWAKACLLAALCLQSSFHTTVNSQLTTSLTGLEDTGVTDVSQLPSETNSTFTSTVSMETSPLPFIESSNKSAEVDVLQPTPTILPHLNSHVLESGVSSSGITPTLPSAELAPLHSTDDVNVNTPEGLIITPSSSVVETIYNTTSDKTMLLSSISTIATIVYTSVLDPVLISATSSFSPELSSSTILPANLTTPPSHSSSTDVNNSSVKNNSSATTVSNSVQSSTSTHSNITNVLATTFSQLVTKPGSTTPLSTTTGVTENLTSATKFLTNSSMKPGDEDRLRSPKDDGLGTPAIIAIGFGSAAAALIVIGIVILVMKRKAYRHKKHDSSNFWDDNVTLSYINSHADFPKDFDAEMMSLDDDSFLNSLDSMTFANLWAADTAKHTNF